MEQSNEENVNNITSDDASPNLSHKEIDQTKKHEEVDNKITNSDLEKHEEVDTHDIEKKKKKGMKKGPNKNQGVKQEYDGPAKRTRRSAISRIEDFPNEPKTTDV
jgi:hypothetical protein